MVMRLTLNAALMLVALSGCSLLSGYSPQAGDILFQDMDSPQSQAVKLATGSEFTHCGVVFEMDGQFVVYEAVGPVRVKPLQDWIDQGVDRRMVAVRLDTLYGYLTPKTLEQMRAVGETHLGKDYDLVFGWSDEKFYCSELVWKIYYEGFGLELTTPRQLGSYDLSHPAVREKLQERYGETVPTEEPVVAPGDLYGSPMLYTVYHD